MRTLILCGGRGTRAYPHTVEIPKPLLQVAGRPILDHVMGLYEACGHADFVLAAGYLGEQIHEFAATCGPERSIDVVDTGVETGTGERVRLCAPRMGPTFFATYADGLGNVDLGALLAFHAAHPGAATLTTVALPSQYGTIETTGDGCVREFLEKPLLHDHRINAGFFVFDERAFELWEGTDLEREVLPALAERGELFAYPHPGFWRSMDTYKDAIELTTLGEAGAPPWLRPSDP